MLSGKIFGLLMNPHKESLPSPLKLECDLFVFGATPAGIASAVRAAREGLRVVLVSVHNRIGGMWSNGVQIFDTLYEGWRGPILAEILERFQEWNARKYGKDSPEFRECFFGSRLQSGGRPLFSPQCALEVLASFVEAEENITMLSGYAIQSASRNGVTLNGVVLRSLEGKRQIHVDAKVFVDASYEGDLFAAAGEEYRVGRESRDEYGEPHAGKIFAQRGGSGRHPYDAACGRLNLRTFRLTTTEIFSGSTGEGDRAVQSYNARLSLSSQPENRVPIPCPHDYDRTRYLGLLRSHADEPERRYPLKSDLVLQGIEKNSLEARVGKLHNWNSANYPEANWDYPDADWEERFVIIRRHVDHALGMLWFLQNDSEVPEHLRERNRAWGLAADEYLECGHLPSEIYVREARRLVGRKVMTEHDAVLASGRERTPDYADSVAFTEWPMDSHDCSMERRAGSLNDGLILLTELTRPACVPFRSLLPKGVDNLLVPVCMSSTHVFWGAIRVEPTWMHIAEAASLAAVLAVRSSRLPAALPVDELQFFLLEKEIPLTFFNDVDLATGGDAAKAAHFFGTRGFFDSFDAMLEVPLDEETFQAWRSRIETQNIKTNGSLPLYAGMSRGEFLRGAFSAVKKGQ